VGAREQGPAGRHHAVALVLVIYAHIFSVGSIEQRIVPFESLPILAEFRTKLQSIGLDLPYVTGAALVVYIVVFQRLSAGIGQLPLVRLSYQQTGIWRAGKCFDELTELARIFEQHLPSSALSDLDVTLELAITEASKDYQDRYRQLVETRHAAAAAWSRYYSAFWLLAVVTIVAAAAAGSGKRAWIAPAGLIAAALVARCGWESQIERSVGARFQYALECARVMASSQQRSERDETIGAHPPNRELTDEDRARKRYEAIKRLLLEAEIAAELLKMPPPGFPYQTVWLLHYVRRIWFLRELGAIPRIKAHVFRSWFERAFNRTAARIGLFRPRGAGQPPESSADLRERHDASIPPSLMRRLDAAWD